MWGIRTQDDSFRYRSSIFTINYPMDKLTTSEEFEMFQINGSELLVQ